MAKNGQKNKKGKQKLNFWDRKSLIQQKINKNFDFASQNWGEKVFELKKSWIPKGITKKFDLLSQNWGKIGQKICKIKK